MNRFSAVLAVLGLLVATSVSLACHRCGRSACTPACVTPTVCCPQTCCTTTCQNAVVWTRVVRYIPVTYRDACGVCRRGCIRRVSMVRTCRPVPVTCCQTVYRSVPTCCVPSCVPRSRSVGCCMTGHRGPLARLFHHQY